MKDSLKKAREKINLIDQEMARLFEERMKAAESVAEYKKEHGIAILDPEREEIVLKKGTERISDDVYKEYYTVFQRNTMAISRAYQSRLIEGMKIAFSGTEGAYAHIAACKLFPTAKKIGYNSFEAAYNAVVNGECDVALLPMENSYNGEVGQVIDLMFSGSLYVNTVTDLEISHDLLAVRGAKIEDIKTVISHPQALGQCREFILSRGYGQIEHKNTAEAAKYVSEKNDPTIAAIASAESADIYNLDVIGTNITSSRSNTTRFAVFSKTANCSKLEDMSLRSIVVFTVKHEAGSLARAINIIGKYGYNLGALRSRPMKNLLWQYYFYLEIEGNLNTEKGSDMINELSEHCDKLKLVGTYKKS